VSNIGRSIASSRAPENPWTGSTSGAFRATNDSASGRHSYLSGRRLDALAAELTDYDKAVLLFLAQVRLATGRQIARRLWSSKTPTDSGAWAARRAIWRLEGPRIIVRLPRRVGGVRGGSASLVYGIGPTGRRLLARQGSAIRRLETPGERSIRHTLAVTELVVSVREADLGGVLDLVQLQTEPACWREFLGGLLAARMMLKPDLFVRIGVWALEDRWWIEVDMATESRSTITIKGKGYVDYYRSGEEQSRHGIFPRTIWAVPDRRRAEEIAEALTHLPTGAGRLFVVWLYGEVIGRLAAEAAS
jgi:hypothetical protein